MDHMCHQFLSWSMYLPSLHISLPINKEERIFEGSNHHSLSLLRNITILKEPCVNGDKMLSCHDELSMRQSYKASTIILYKKSTLSMERVCIITRKKTSLMGIILITIHNNNTSSTMKNFNRI